MFFPPIVNGYEEIRTWPRSMFESDSGKTFFSSKMDTYNETTELPQFPAFTVQASYHFTNIRDIRTFESLVQLGQTSTIIMPLWIGVLTVTGTGGVTATLGTTTPFNNYLYYTAISHGKFPTAVGSPYPPTPDISLLFVDPDDKYDFTHRAASTISAVNYFSLASTAVTFTSSSYISGIADNDKAYSCIEGAIETVDFNYSMTGPEELKATITVRQM